jgi:hypothetical protein
VWTCRGAPQLKDCGLLVAAGVFESTSSGALHWTSGSWIWERIFARPDNARGTFLAMEKHAAAVGGLGLQLQAGSARLTAVLDVLVLRDAVLRDAVTEQ